MLCFNCGTEIPDGCRFCPKCGTTLDAYTEGSSAAAGAQPDGFYERPTRGVDGKYRWTHEIHLLSDTTVPAAVLKVLLIACCVPAFLLLFLSILEGDFWEALPKLAAVIGGIFAIAVALFAIGYYLIFIPIMGNRYHILFEMDEIGVRHIEMPPSVKRTELISLMGVLAGMAAGSPTVVGAHLLAGPRKEMYTKFKDIRKICI
jgi:hypothetical protein